MAKPAPDPRKQRQLQILQDSLADKKRAVARAQQALRTAQKARDDLVAALAKERGKSQKIQLPDRIRELERQLDAADTTVESKDRTLQHAEFEVYRIEQMIDDL